MKEQDRNPPSRVRDNRLPDLRSVYGHHEDRLCGLYDLLQRARGMSVLDIAMNHGLVGFEFARNGATLVHGCDFDEAAVNTARTIFTEIAIPSRFEVVDLVGGSAALETAFGPYYLPRYDIVLFLGIYHKLQEQAPAAVISELVRHLVSRVARFFVVRTSQIDELGLILADTGLRRVHFSALSLVVGPLEVWERG